jgi:hypothetical protein
MRAIHLLQQRPLFSRPCTERGRGTQKHSAIETHEEKKGMLEEEKMATNAEG